MSIKCRTPESLSPAISRNGTSIYWPTPNAGGLSHHCLERGGGEGIRSSSLLFGCLYRPDQVDGCPALVLVKAPLTKGRLVSLPFCDYGGLLADNDDAARMLCEQSLSLAAKLDTGVEIRTQSLFQLLADDARFLQITEKCRMVLELPGSANILWAGFKSKLRSQVNRASKDGLICRLGRNELLPDFYRVFACNMRDLGSPVHSRKWLREVLAAYGERARIGVVYKGDIPLAAGIVLAHGKTMTIPWASALREFSKLSPNMLLYWSFLEKAADNGFQFFDFGRSTPGEGTYAFKKQWGAQPVPLYWYRLTEPGSASMTRPEAGTGSLRRIVERVWQRFPVAVVNSLGPHLRKYIDK